jgi:activator of HSP90 ATPase
MANSIGYGCMLPNPTRRQLLVFGAIAIGEFGALSAARAGADDSGISHAADSIHQEPLIHAPASRVYAALTQALLFDRVVQLSEAIKSMSLAPKPSEIDARPGGAFSLFGGYISGLFIELVPDKLLVQAWHSASWAAGLYSIAHFELVAQGEATKIVFDHGGFPAGQAASLAHGWQVNYWAPLNTLLT